MKQKQFPRSRVVTFRVTSEQYEDIKAMCDGTTNCVSELAREAVVGNKGLRLRELDRRLAGLDRKLDQVIELLDKQSPA